MSNVERRTSLSELFEPLQVAHLKMRNRIAHPAIVGNLGVAGLPTTDQVDYYKVRARGGAALIVTEGMSVHKSSDPNPAVVRIYDDSSIPGLRAIAEAVHAEGAHVLMQLWHVGRQQLWGPRVTPWGVSSLPDPLSGVVPHVMSTSELGEIVDAYVSCAVRARECGYDGVEIHGAHGYLITQSLSPWTNSRDDAYGGDFDGRMRLLREVMLGIRGACGTDWLLALKLSGSEFVDGGLRPDDTVNIIRALEADQAVDLVAIGQGNFSHSLENHVPDMHFPDAPFAPMIRSIAKAVKTPLVALGKITDPVVACGIVKSGAAMVGMGRALISDPDAPNKWQGISDGAVRPCIACNVCWNSIHRGGRITCIHSNAVFGSGPTSRSPARSIRREVAVVGGGPAGMEVAWRAASRGCRVTLWEENSELGGCARLLAELPGLEEFARLLDFQRERLVEFGVKVNLDAPVDSTSLRELQGSVVFATGSDAQAPPSCLEGVPVFAPTSEHWSKLREFPSEAEIVVFDEDGGYYAYGPALQLSEFGLSVVLVTSRTGFGDKLGYLARIGLHRSLRLRHIETLTGVALVGMRDGFLLLKDVFTGEVSERTCPMAVVWAGARVARDSLWRESRNSAVLTPIGDARSPRDIASAIYEGRDVGLAL